MPAVLAPPPDQTPIILVPQTRDWREFISKFTGDMSRIWYEWFTLTILARIQNTAQLFVGKVSLTGQQAAIGTTTVPLGAITAGVYRVSYRTRVTQAAGTSSSYTVTIGWTEGQQTISQSFVAIAGNTVTTQQNNSVTFRADGGSPITYAVAYSSTGAPVMQFNFDLVVEQLV